MPTPAAPSANFSSPPPASVTRVNGAGFRDYSDQRATRGAVRVQLAPGAAAGTGLVVAARLSDVSLAQSPGALTRAQFDADPRQADALSVRKQAGKIVRQGDLALTLARALGGGTLDALVYGGVRTLAVVLGDERTRYLFALLVLVVCIYGFRFMLLVNKIAVVAATLLFTLAPMAMAPRA